MQEMMKKFKFILPKDTLRLSSWVKNRAHKLWCARKMKRRKGRSGQKLKWTFSNIIIMRTNVLKKFLFLHRCCLCAAVTFGGNFIFQLSIVVVCSRSWSYKSFSSCLLPFQKFFLELLFKSFKITKSCWRNETPKINIRMQKFKLNLIKRQQTIKLNKGWPLPSFSSETNVFHWSQQDLLYSALCAKKFNSN